MKRRARPLAELDLPTRVVNALKREYIYTVEDLAEMRVRDLLNVPNLGSGAFCEIGIALSKEWVMIRFPRRPYILP